MKTRSLAYGFVAALGFVAIASSAFLWSHEYRRLEDLREGRALIETIAPALKFVDALGRERGLYNEVLIAHDKSSAELAKELSERHQATDPLFKQTLRAASRLPGPLAGDIEALVSNAQTEVMEARLQARPYIERQGPADVDEADRLLARYRTAAGLIANAVAAVDRRVTEIDASLGLCLDIARLTNDIRELAGKRSAILTRYVALRVALSLEDRITLAKASGAIEITWARLQRLADAIGSDRIAKGVARVKREFFENGDPVYQAFLDAARTNAEPPMSLAEWRKWSTEKLGDALATRDVPVAEVDERLSAMQSDSILRASLGFAGLASLLFGLIAIGAYMERRLLSPIAQLTRLLDSGATSEATVGSTALARRFADRDDEIGSLARAVIGMRSHAGDLQAANDRVDALIDNLPQGVCLYDAKDFLIVANSRYAELYGFPEAEALLGLKFDTVLELYHIVAGRETPNGDEKLREQAAERRETEGRVARYLVNMPDGRIIAVNGRRIPGGGWLSTHLDITRFRRAEEKIAFLAEHDALTGLANRAQFGRRLDEALASVDDAHPFAIMCLDLDRFKLVNDMFGHAAGDELLRMVAARLRALLGPDNCIARVGGDEFSLLIEAGSDDVAGLARRIVSALSEPYDLDGQRAEVSASVGIAIGPTDADSARALLRAADLALYGAKLEGRQAFRFYEPAMDESQQLRRALQFDMRGAIANGEFELNYQPIVNVERNEIVTFEALLRWNHPQRGRISPAEFIPLAEDSNLIVELGAWTVKRACIEARGWPGDLKVAVNLSPRQFGGERLLADIVSALAESGLPPWRLELEITERVMLVNTEATIATLFQLRELGVSIAMDDFGTGYSSLSYLRRFPFDKIKIDQLFIRDITRDENAVAIVRAVKDLARGLNMSTTAEGVETLEQFERLRAEGCTEAQGYFISRPVAADQVERVLERHAGARVAA